MKRLESISNVIIACDEEWGPMWMSKHHYAYELSKLNTDVYFINPPTKWRVLNFLRKIRVNRIDNVNVVTIENRFPIFKIKFLAKLNDQIIRYILTKQNILQPKSLIWNFDGRRFGFSGYQSIYHIVDSNKTAVLDEFTAKNATLMVCVSELFTKQYPTIKCPIITIPHGVSSDEFDLDQHKIKALKKKYKNYFLNAGSFSEKTNLKLLQLIADTFPEFNIVLLGKLYFKNYNNWTQLIESKNVHYLGAVPAKELKNYISAASICLTTYHFDHAAKVNAGAGSSLKHMNYMAQKKITISTLSNDIGQLQNNGIYTALSNKDFISTIKAALNNKLRVDENLINDELQKLLYPILIEKILDKLPFTKAVPRKIELNDSSTIKGQNILIVSNEGWGKIWYSKHNYAYELSKNNNVLFVNPLTKWKPASFFNSQIKMEGIGTNLAQLSYNSPLPSRGVILHRINNWIVSKRLNKWLKAHQFCNFIQWSFDPFRLYNPKLLGGKLSIYHCVDLYGFKYYGEDQIASNSDLIFVSSSTFFGTYKNYNKSIFLLPHGISIEEFNIDENEAKAVKISSTDFGLYTGVIDNRIDFDLVEKAVIKFSEISFLFIGPLNLPDDEIAHRIFIENKYPNVIALGPVHFKKLKFYIVQSKFCISFMNIKIEGNMIAHHKSLNYLSHGKPVFGSIFSDYEKLDDIFYMSNNHEVLLKMLSDFISLGESSKLADKRIAYARSHTFENILLQAHKHIKDVRFS
jgi:hypothetical protein